MNPKNIALRSIWRKFTLLTYLAFVAAMFPAAGEGPPLNGDLEKAKVVSQTFEKWVEAYAAGDLKGVMSIFDPDVQFSFQGAPDQHYKDLENSYAQDFRSRAPGTKWVPNLQEIYADGSLAFVRSIWELRITKDGNTEVKARNRSMDVLRTDKNGHWLIFRSINYPEKSPTKSGPS